MRNVLIFVIFSQYLAAQDVVSAWFPNHVGDTWIYQHEERDGSNGGGMADPEIGRWRVEESIIRSTRIPEGVLLLKRTRPLDPIPTVIARHMPGFEKVRESYYLIHGNCVYGDDWLRVAENDQLQSQYRDELLRGQAQADFCFPLKKGLIWHTEVPGPDGVWTVVGVNADPFGLSNGTTFHFSGRAGSGTMIDRWFAQGIGVLQEITEHHGTYEESRRQLLSSVIDGRARSYQLTPARTVPLNSWDCDGAGWQHFARMDGSAFRDQAACASYAPR